MIDGCRDKNFEQRLEVLKLTTLNMRFERADLIQVYKVLNDTKHIYPEGFLELSDRRGRNNCKKLFLKRNVFEVRIASHLELWIYGMHYQMKLSWLQM